MKRFCCCLLALALGAGLISCGAGRTESVVVSAVESVDAADPPQTSSEASEPAVSSAPSSRPSQPTSRTQTPAATASTVHTSSAPKPSTPAPSSTPVASAAPTESRPAQPTLPSNDAGTVYWYYQNMTTEQRRLYDRMQEAARAMQTGLIDLGSCSTSDLTIAYHGLLSDHPEYFWLPSAYLSGTTGEGRRFIAFDYRDDVSYLVTAAERDAMQRRLDALLTDLDRKAKGDTAYALELYLHDFLCGRTTYNFNATPDPMDYTAYGALIGGRAVCEGYARAFQLLCTRYGLPCILVKGEANGAGHMWNAVRLDGNWYHVDVTWDDSASRPVHSYFNLTDALIREDHAIDAGIVKGEALRPDWISGNQSFNFCLPTCTADAQCYFRQTGVTLSPQLETAKRQICDALAAAYPDREMIEFLVPASARPGSLTTEWIVKTYDFTTLFREAGKQIQAKTGKPFPGAYYAAAGPAFSIFWDKAA